MNTIQTTKTKPYTEITVFLLIAAAVALTVWVVAHTGLLPFGLTADATRDGALNITAKEFEFTQTKLHVTAGQTIRLELNNDDLLPHSFDLDEFDLHINMPGSERIVSEFTPTEPGTYTFYCGIPGHEALGMVGTLVVEPK